MKLKLLNLIVALYVTGCAHKSATPIWGEDIVMPSGNKAVAVHCDATRIECLSYAGRKCPKGYEIKSENYMNSARADAGHGTAAAAAAQELGMVVECKNPES